jgi:hypothetical protein
VFALTGAGAALAHECFNANRSANGNEAAGTHSRNWTAVTLFEFYVFEAGLSEADAEAALALLPADVPTEATIFFGPVTIGQHGRAFNEGGKASDGKAIDWFFTTYGEDVIVALCAVDPGNDFCTGGP